MKKNNNAKPAISHPCPRVCPKLARKPTYFIYAKDQWKPPQSYPRLYAYAQLKTISMSVSLRKIERQTENTFSNANNTENS